MGSEMCIRDRLTCFSSTPALLNIVCSRAQYPCLVVGKRPYLPAIKDYRSLLAPPAVAAATIPLLHLLQAYAPDTNQVLQPHTMSRVPQQPYSAPTRPNFSPLQSPSASHTTSCSSMASRSSTTPAPPVAPSTSPQQQQFFGSLNEQAQQPQQQQQQHQEKPMQAQRHPSFDYQPNRTGAGQTATETTNYLNQTGLLAEAAKRAQMACVMRDLDGMEL